MDYDMLSHPGDKNKGRVPTLATPLFLSPGWEAIDWADQYLQKERNGRWVQSYPARPAQSGRRETFWQLPCS
jgi:hypothetical protein